jgi:4a-hydroxytetrahydrobiopterin dehydratase
MERLPESEIHARLDGSAWSLRDESVERDFERKDFADAIAFVNAVAKLAEDLDHHPDILVHGYRHVRLTLSTHSAGGLTERDFALADAIDALV